MKLECVGGPVDFTAPIDTNPFTPDSFRPHPNVVKGTVAAHQWVKGTKWTYGPATVSALCFPRDGAAPPVVEPVPYVY